MGTDHKPVVRTLRGSPFRSLAEFFNQHGKCSQRFRIDPQRRSTVIGEAGTRLTIYPNALCDLYGRPVAGEVELALTELLSRPELFLSGRPTCSNSQVLETAGQFFLQASQNYLPLQLRQPIAVEWPQQENHLRNSFALRHYVGAKSSTRIYRGGSQFDWRLVDRRPLRLHKLGARKYYHFHLSEFNWVSAGRQLVRRTARRKMVSAKLVHPVDQLEDQAVYLVLESTNAFVRMHFTGRQFTCFNIPVKRPAKVIALGIRHGALLYGCNRIAKTSNELVRVRMDKISEADLLEALYLL